MFKNLSIRFVVLSSAMIFVLAGCVSSQKNLAIVSQTLLTYQVGKTTFKDLKTDAGLEKRQSPQTKPLKSYLTQASPIPLFNQTNVTYKLVARSPWWLYETDTQVKVISGDFTYKYRFVIGDIKKPISILSFDGDGKLIEISPLH